MPAAKKTTKKLPTPRAKPAKPKAVATKPGRRADYGASTDGFFAKQTPQLRKILDALRTLIEEAAPEATSSLKWGTPFFMVEGKMMCALGSHKAHVNLILAGPPEAFTDKEGRLAGEGKMGRHLKLTSVDDIPRAAVRMWLRTAAKLARATEKQEAAG